MNSTSKLQDAVRKLGAAVGLKGARLHVQLNAITDHGTIASMFVALDGPECEALYNVTVGAVTSKPGELKKHHVRIDAADEFAKEVMEVLNQGKSRDP